MKMSEGVEWTIHCLVVLAGLPPGATVPGARLAELHGVPGPYLGKSLQALSRAGILRSDPGARGGYRLGRPPEEITLLDVVLAVDGPEPAFRCMEIRQKGPASSKDPAVYLKPCTVHAAMQRAELAWRRELAAQTLADLRTRVHRAIPADVQERMRDWLAGAIRS